MEFMFRLLVVFGDDDLRFDPDDAEFLAAAADAAACCCCICGAGITGAGDCPGFELDEALGLPPLPPLAAALLFDTELWGEPAAMAEAAAAADDNDGLLVPIPNGLLDEVIPKDICVW